MEVSMALTLFEDRKQKFAEVPIHGKWVQTILKGIQE